MFVRLVLSVMLASLAPYALGQTGEDPVYQTGVQSVLVNVTVTGKGGQPVTGLSEHDFELMENGKPQKVSYFMEHPSGPPPAVAAAPPQQPDVFTNEQPGPVPDAVDVLLIDTLNTSLADQVQLRKQVIQHLEGLPHGARIAIFTMSVKLGFVQGFTSDPEQLLAALAKAEMNPQYSPLLKTSLDATADQQSTHQMQEMAVATQDANAAAAASSMMRFLDERDMARTDQRVDLTLQNLQALGRYLSSVPGRKNLIWFSGAFPINMFPSAAGNLEGNLSAGTAAEAPIGETVNDASPRFYSSALKRTAELLHAAQVAVYPVDAEGLAPTDFYDAGAPPSNPGTSEGQRQTVAFGNEVATRSARFATMDQLADETGGKAYYNTNALGRAMADVINHGQYFYTLAYTPTDKEMHGEFRKIKVHVSGGSYKLSYRSGYYAVSRQALLTTEATQSPDPLREYMALGMPDFHQIAYKVLVQPAKAGGEAAAAASAAAKASPTADYDIYFALPVESIELAAGPDGVRHGAVDLSLFAYDGKGRPVFQVARQITMNISPADYAKYRQVGLQLHEAIRLPKGQLILRTGMFDPASARVGTLDIPMSKVTAPGA
jgi:VWFA-related protein